MRLHRVPLRRRDGFTLIELLVVMAIIAVLVSLTTAAVFSAFGKMSEVKCRNEITGLSTSIKEFESDFSVTTPPPSRIWLDGSGPTAYTTAPVGFTPAQLPQLQQLAIDSQAYLRKVWPRINIQNPAGIAWNSGVAGRPNNVVLEGEECLVFFLGGAQNPANGAFLGFSTDPSNPMSNTAKRKGPYFQFVMSRVANGPHFPIYFDAYSNSPVKPATDKPYAYFSSGKSANGYNAYAANPALGFDCPALGALQPYFQPGGPPTVFYNPDTYQIISAGKNQTFGPGGSYSPATSSTIGKAGDDDLTNFSSVKLGAGQ